MSKCHYTKDDRNLFAIQTVPVIMEIKQLILAKTKRLKKLQNSSNKLDFANQLTLQRIIIFLKICKGYQLDI